MWGFCDLNVVHFSLMKKEDLMKTYQRMTVKGYKKPQLVYLTFCIYLARKSEGSVFKDS